MVFISYFDVQEVSEKRVPIILCGNKVDQRAAATAEGRRYVLYSPLIGRRITEHTLIGRRYSVYSPLIGRREYIFPSNRSQTLNSLLIGVR